MHSQERKGNYVFKKVKAIKHVGYLRSPFSIAVGWDSYWYGTSL